MDVSGRDFLPFPDLAQSVRDDVRTVRESPLVARDTVVSTAGADGVCSGQRTGLMCASYNRFVTVEGGSGGTSIYLVGTEKASWPA